MSIDIQGTFYRLTGFRERGLTLIVVIWRFTTRGRCDLILNKPQNYAALLGKQCRFGSISHSLPILLYFYYNVFKLEVAEMLKGHIRKQPKCPHPCSTHSLSTMCAFGKCVLTIRNIHN